MQAYYCGIWLLEERTFHRRWRGSLDSLCWEQPISGTAGEFRFPIQVTDRQRGSRSYRKWSRDGSSSCRFWTWGPNLWGSAPERGNCEQRKRRSGGVKAWRGCRGEVQEGRSRGDGPWAGGSLARRGCNPAAKTDKWHKGHVTSWQCVFSLR